MWASLAPAARACSCGRDFLDRSQRVFQGTCDEIVRGYFRLPTWFARFSRSRLPHTMLLGRAGLERAGVYFARLLVGGGRRHAGGGALVKEGRFRCAALTCALVRLMSG